MAGNTNERQAVIQWFKTDFSEEARATTKTSRLADGKLSYRFSVTNNSGFDFDKFSFKVKVINKADDSDLGMAVIDAGAWASGEKKNFKSKLSIPENVSNISFVMFAESVDYVVKNPIDSLTGAAKDMVDAAKNMGQAMGKAGEGIEGVFGELFGTGGMPQTEQKTVTKTTTTKTKNGTTTTKTTTTTTSGGGGMKDPFDSMPFGGSNTRGKVTVPAQGSYAKRKSDKKMGKMRLGKSGGALALVITGAFFAIAALGSVDYRYEMITYSAIAVASFIAAALLKKSRTNRANRIRVYETKVNKKGNTSIDDLAASVGMSFDKTADELQQLILDGFFPEAYVDIQNRLLVMTKGGVPMEDVAKSAAMNKKAKRKAARDGGLVPESLDDLITMTDDSEIKGKLKTLRSITQKIDARVEEVPELEDQVKDFREKYYPEVVRLTDQYNEKIADLGKIGSEIQKGEVTESASGAPVINSNPNYLQEQADDIKKQLISLIDSVTEASENLLEKLHEGDILDISTDIQMLQTTLASKGLLDSDFDIKE